VLDFDSNGHLLSIEIIGAGDLVAAHVLAAAKRH
jgi:uncharacterized protein YuzE